MARSSKKSWKITRDVLGLSQWSQIVVSLNSGITGHKWEDQWKLRRRARRSGTHLTWDLRNVYSTLAGALCVTHRNSADMCSHWSALSRVISNLLSHWLVFLSCDPELSNGCSDNRCLFMWRNIGVDSPFFKQISAFFDSCFSF